MAKRTIGVRAAATATVLSLFLAVSACTSAPSAKVATDTEAVTHAQNDRVPDGAAWTQHYFPSTVPSSDESKVELHADVLLPEELPEGKKVPVILSVGAYFSHAGELGTAGSAEDFDHTGPSARFNDFIEGTDLFNEGYAFVQVDLRGFGGSSGCLDFMGTGEQGDVEAAIDWAASQPWSTGAVGMYGKSYDAVTGLVGNNLDNDSLKAVVAQEPIWDLYRNLRSNGVPRTPIVDASRSYNETARLTGLPDDNKRYRANATNDAASQGCEIINSAGYRTADPESQYWKDRDLAAKAAGSDTPLFFTQGFLEVVTQPEAMEEYLTNHEGPQRGWLGQWDHVRGNEVTSDGELAMGRKGWFTETMAFYDEYLKDIEPSVEYPAFAIQDSTGSWRGQDTWPEAKSAAVIELGDATYVDDGAEGDPAVQTGNSSLQWSAPVAEDTRITGTPKLSFTASAPGNVMVKLYDVAPDGTAINFDEQVAVLNPGASTFDLKSTDWTLASGHALAVDIGTIKSSLVNNWITTPSHQTIAVTGVQLSLALDDPADDSAVDGERAPYLDTFVAYSTTQLPAASPTFAIPSVRG